jgi:Flp pilus assembly protein TadB/uncharacterized protein YegL
MRVPARFLTVVAALLTLAGSPAAAATPSASGDPTPPGEPGARTTVLVVDTSGSMKGENIGAAHSAITAYVAALPPDVAVGLVRFSNRPQVVLQPTSDRAVLHEAVVDLPLGGNTSLYDSILAAIAIAGRADSSNIVVLSDGNDTSSRNGLAATLRRVAEADVRVDAVDVRAGRRPRTELRRITSAAGGRVVTAANAAELAALMAALSRETQPDHSESTASPPSPPSPAMTPRLWLVLGLCFVALTTLLLLGFHLAFRSGKRSTRLRRMLASYGASAGPTTAAGASDSLAARSPVLGVVFSVATRLAAKEAIGGRLAALLQRANLRLTPVEWLVTAFSVAVGTGAVSAVAPGSTVLGGLAGAAIGLLATAGWLVFAAERRARAFSDRLPDALQMLASSVATGFGISQACDVVASGGPQPVADEFAKAMVDVRLGLPLTDALERVAVRMRSSDLELTVMSIGIQSEVGGNLAEVLRGIVATMRERSYLRRQIKTLSAEGRLSAYILIALPIAMLGYLLALRPAYVRPLYTDPIGIAMSVAATVMLLLGVFVMHKMVKVDV